LEETYLNSPELNFRILVVGFLPIIFEKVPAALLISE